MVNLLRDGSLPTLATDGTLSENDAATALATGSAPNKSLIQEFFNSNTLQELDDAFCHAFTVGTSGVVDERVPSFGTELPLVKAFWTTTGEFTECYKPYAEVVQRILLSRAKLIRETSRNSVPVSFEA